MNIYRSEKFHFANEIFPQGFILKDFEEDFIQSQNILKDDKSAEIRLDRMWEKGDVLFSSLQIYRGKYLTGDAYTQKNYIDYK